MKILIVSNIFHPDHEGGAEKVARRTAEALSVEHDVHVLCTKNNTNNYGVENLNYKIERIHYRNIYQYSVKQTSKNLLSKIVWHIINSINGVDKKEISGIFTKIKPDVVYLHNSLAFIPQLTHYCSINNIPICLHLHDYSFLCPKTSMFDHGKNCAQQCVTCKALTLPARRSLSSVKSVIAVSKYLKNKYQRHELLSNMKWHVVRNIENKRSKVPLHKKSPQITNPLK